MLKARIILIILLCISLYIAIFEFILPKTIQNDQSNFLNKLAELPDVDFRPIAEEYASKDDFISAISVLEYISVNNMADKFPVEHLKQVYSKKLEDKNSILGKAYSAGKGFLTGEIDDLSSLAGATTGDFIIWGDFRDLTKELILKDNTDEVVVLLSAAGLASSLYPPADPGVSLAKNAKKAGLFSPKMLNFLKMVLKGFSDYNNSEKITKLQNIFIPIYELYKKSGSWSQFSLRLQSCNDIDQINQLNKLIDILPEKSHYFSHIFSISHKFNQSNQLIEFMSKCGQQSFEYIYGNLRKGKTGIDIILQNPCVNTSIAQEDLDISFKHSSFLPKDLSLAWYDFSKNSTLLAYLFKYLSIVFLFFIILITLFGKKFIIKIFNLFNSKKIDYTKFQLIKNFTLLIGILIFLTSIIALINYSIDF
ncbi:MAG: hypothetical protein LBR11_02605 [Deltaproteobacteria bacterium]|jgi:hypothetical protein|nr:hypothetical protein [Deltaproteobacteria bacterium]